MKRFGIMSAAILLLSLSSVASAYSLQEKQEEKAPPAKQQAPPKQQEQPKQQAQPKPQAQPKQQAQQKPAAQPKQQEKPAAAKSQPVRTPSATPKSQPATAKNQPARTPAATPKAQPVKTQPAPAKSQPSTTRTQQTGAQQHVVRTSAEVSKQNSAPALRLSARGSGRIPDDRFRANFGAGHNFHIGSPVIVGGFSRFQYGGFWFGFVDPWPSGWYYTDSVYIDYVDGGYYMYDPYYPGARISISVVI
jgi:hypothetical protein